MKYRFAFAGFRHPHILSLWEGVRNHPRCEIVAACETDAATRQTLEKAGQIRITHGDFDRMLAEISCDVVAIGDVYSKRGPLCLRALETGRHVLSDKPLCTERAQLGRIRDLARQKNLSLGCQLDLGEFPPMRRLREVLRQDRIGKICTVTIFAQHPLRLGSRAAWYFEPGSHGGTINDIGIHIFDLVPWLTGRSWERLLSARQWNAKAAIHPHFNDAAQFYGTLENKITCFADMSYLAPDLLGYELPQYWRVTVHGTEGMAEASLPTGRVVLVRNDDKAPGELPGLEAPPLAYLDDFLAEIAGEKRPEGMTTARVLLASGLALEAQHAADTEATGPGIPFSP
jgi:predicted dehydrogenase